MTKVGVHHRKTGSDKAPSTLAVIGRYILEPEIFDSLKKIPKGAGGEIQLTDAIAGELEKEEHLCLFLRR